MGLERISPNDVYQPFHNMYSQVIRFRGGTQVEIAGTVSMDADRQLVGEGDMATQVRVTFENVGKSLAAAGAKPSDVTRVNIFTLDVDRFLQEGGSEMMNFFGGTSPVSTLVGVTRLADPRYLVEIEATAVIG
jgi:enamine deaminase RidA (YjgF/YER057c/UK114 family)